MVVESKESDVATVVNTDDVIASGVADQPTEAATQMRVDVATHSAATAILSLHLRSEKRYVAHTRSI